MICSLSITGIKALIIDNIQHVARREREELLGMVVAWKSQVWGMKFTDSYLSFFGNPGFWDTCSYVTTESTACSRHWFFGANLIVDGEKVPETLMGLVKDTLRANPNNSVIGFHDNSSAIRYKSV